MIAETCIVGIVLAAYNNAKDMKEIDAHNLIYILYAQAMCLSSLNVVTLVLISMYLCC